MGHCDAVDVGFSSMLFTSTETIRLIRDGHLDFHTSPELAAGVPESVLHMCDLTCVCLCAVLHVCDLTCVCLCAAGVLSPSCL